MRVSAPDSHVFEIEFGLNRPIRLLLLFVVGLLRHAIYERIEDPFGCCIDELLDSYVV